MSLLQPNWCQNMRWLRFNPIIKGAGWVSPHVRTWVISWQVFDQRAEQGHSSPVTPVRALLDLEVVAKMWIWVAVVPDMWLCCLEAVSRVCHARA